VVLESIDRDRESPESFAIKLSVRMRTPLPRVRQVVSWLPCTVKRGLSVDQANRLKETLEGIGGRVRVQSYLETPGAETTEPSSGPLFLGQEDTEEGVVEMRECLECGSPLDGGAECCSACRGQTPPEEHRVEGVPTESHPREASSTESHPREASSTESHPREASSTESHPREASPKESAVEKHGPVAETVHTQLDLVKVLRENKFLIAAGILAILLVIAIIKQ
jgi:hypothetical protein